MGPVIGYKLHRTIPPPIRYPPQNPCGVTQNLVIMCLVKRADISQVVENVNFSLKKKKNRSKMKTQLKTRFVSIPFFSRSDVIESLVSFFFKD